MNKAGLFFLVAAWGFSLRAAITFSPEENAIRVVDYSQTSPCDPERLLRADRLNGWNKVHYDKVSDTYRVNAALWIGDNHGGDTYFQIGDKSHPRITVIVKGDVFVRPYWVKSKNPGKNWWTFQGDRRVNRLTLGDVADVSIRPTLLIDNAESKGYTLRVGGGGINAIHGGQIRAYNARIAALGDNPKTRLGAIEKGKPNAVSLSGYQSDILKNVTISKAAAMMSYGMYNMFGGVMENVTFEDGGTALMSGVTYAKGLNIERCSVGVLDYGDLDMTLENCVFLDNDRNWELTCGKGLTCVDCVVFPSRNGDVYKMSKNPKTGEKVYPRFLSKRRIVVATLDANGEPLAGATVIARPETSAPEVPDQVKAVTATDGKTPLLLVDEIRRATDVPSQPEIREFSWRIEAVASDGRRGELTGARPEKSGKTVSLKLH